MPALGNRGEVRPEAIKKAAAKPAPKLPVQKAPVSLKGVTGTTRAPSKAPSGGVKGTAKGTVKTTHRGILGTVEHAAGSALRSISPGGGANRAVLGAILPAVAPGAAGAGGKPLRDLAEHYEDTGQALTHDPFGTLQHTAESVPAYGNALVTGFGRMGVGLAQGHFLREGKAFAHGLEEQVKQELSHGHKDVERQEHEGIINELANATLAVGGASRLLAGAGRVTIPESKLAVAMKAVSDYNEARRTEALGKAAGHNVQRTTAQEGLQGAQAGPSIDKLPHDHPELGAFGSAREKAVLEAARNNPDRMVNIYRAVTPGTNEIRPGDWVSIKKPSHGLAAHLKVIRKQVPASHIRFNPDELKDPEAPTLQFAYGPTQHVEFPRVPTKAERRAAFIGETLHGKRPNLRTTPGAREVSRTPGAGLKPQERSKGLLTSAFQTQLDRTRFNRQVASLNRVGEARLRAALNPHMAGSELGDIYAHQLAHDTHRGEVMPLTQMGNRLGGSKFLGANRSQRIGVARTVSGERIVKERQLHVLKHEIAKGMKPLSEPQKKLLTLAKEGKLNLDDPAKALEHLRQIHELARRGSTNVTTGLHDIKDGTEVARETGAVLKHIEQHGAESVFTPEFRHAVQTIPDERRLSEQNPVLARIADQVVARKYLPQMAFLHDAALLRPDHPDSLATIHGVTQIHQLLEHGHNYRAAARGLPADLAHTPEAQALEHDRIAQRLAEIKLQRMNAAHNNGRYTPAQVSRQIEVAKNAKDATVRSRKAFAELRRNPQELHARADEAFTTSHNLANEIAQMHGLPTDRAYIPHVRSQREIRATGTTGYSPADYKRWEGILQRNGTMSLNPDLIFRGIERSARDISTQRIVNDIEKKHSVRLPRKNMTVQQLQTWMNNSGRNPEDFRIVHFGQLRRDIQGMADAGNLQHLNLSEGAHLAILEHALKNASTGLRSTDKGARLIPKAAYDELSNFFHESPTVAKVAGRTKGQVSKLMLGLSLPWAVGMYPAYALQSLAGGAGPVDFASNLKWYKGLSEKDKLYFDHPMGIDSPYIPGSHGIEKERVGTPTSLQGLSDQMRVMKASPLGRALSSANPVDRILGFERHARRGSRINLSVKGVKNEAIRQMVSDMADGQKAMNSFEVKLKKLQMAGRMPSKEYMNKALANQDAMEKVAEHVEHVMGNFHHMSAFEKNVVNRTFMFYPWLRYSLKLLAHTLPTRHPMLFALGLKMGQMEHRELHELLGTDPQLGEIYLGAPQPGVKPEKRQFSQINMRDINPVLNSAVTAISPATGGNLGQLLGTVPPYITSFIGYLANKDLYTDKPLTGAKVGEAQGVKSGRPSLFGYAAHEGEQYFFPTRVLGHQLGGKRPQSSEGAPAFGLSRPKEYSRKTERKIGREPSGHHLLSELFPFVPEPAERIPQLVEKEKGEAKERKHLARKQARRDEQEAQGTWVVDK